MSLLEDKGIPPLKMAEAAIMAVTIVGSIAYSLHIVSYELEVHFHIFNHTAHENVDEIRAHPGMLAGLVACYPLLAALGMVLLLPLGPYVSEHAAFQKLHVLRPDHYFKLVIKVYTAWASTKNGKLASKDL